MLRIKDRETVICFQCEGSPGFYFEFVRSGFNYEKMTCPKCRKAAYTVPASYLMAMPIVELVKLFGVMAQKTPFMPFVDLSIQYMPLPHAILYRRTAA